jgi:hypothetical protein
MIWAQILEHRRTTVFGKKDPAFHTIPEPAMHRRFRSNHNLAFKIEGTSAFAESGS